MRRSRAKEEGDGEAAWVGREKRGWKVGISVAMEGVGGRCGL